MSPLKLAVLLVTSVALATPAEPKAAIGNAVQGKAEYAQCSSCHQGGVAGPKLEGLFRRKRMADKKTPLSEANVRLRITQGGDGMPPFRSLSKKQVDDLIAYLKTI
jgi:mono/diheme cytochrome c family protein